MNIALKPLALAISTSTLLLVACNNTDEASRQQATLDTTSDAPNHVHHVSPVPPPEPINAPQQTEAEQRAQELHDEIAINEYDSSSPQIKVQAQSQVQYESLRVKTLEKKKEDGRHRPARAIEEQVGRLPAGKMIATPAALSHNIVPAYTPAQPGAGENYEALESNSFNQVNSDPVSTFSIDVDTASYANVRRFINNGNLPPQHAVRVEEMVNYFNYDYSVPEDATQPFLVNHEIAPSPWNPGRHLMQIGIKGFEQSQQHNLASNLVFLIDVSGSMHSPDKLDLLKQSLKMLVKQMDSNDNIAIAVYAGAAGLVLDATPGNQKATIINAIDRLQAGGSTNGAAGIELAYQVASEHFIKEGVNRVILATDGDFNVGMSGVDELKSFIEKKRKTGISLSVLGFGSGNYNDHMMEELSNHGNGNAAYIDSLKEAHKVLVTEMNSTLLTIAKDVKIQVEFNPDQVQEYRLVGYENRMLNREDFNNDKIDAGDIGAGHTVTALYELILTDSNNPTVDPLRYGKDQGKTEYKSTGSLELATVKLRYKLPDEHKSTKIEFHVKRSDISNNLDNASADLRFATAVAGFGQLLKNDEHLNDFTYSDVKLLATNARGKDEYGYRGEFIQLINLAETLTN